MSISELCKMYELENAKEEGRKEGIEKGIEIISKVIRLYLQGLDSKAIAKEANYSLEKVEKIIIYFNEP